MERTDSSSDSNPLSRLPESRSYLHIQVCENLIYPTGRWGARESVKRTLDPSPTSVQDVGVNHFRGHVIMSEKFLNCVPSPHFACIGIFAVAGGKAKCAYASTDRENRLRRARKKSGVLQTPGSDIFWIGW